MPRIFHVTLTKEIDTTVVADSAEELRAALTKQKHEFDDWADYADWRISILDPLRLTTSVERIPTKFSEPEMGVDDDGNCADIYDYKREHPDYMDKVEAEAREVIRQVNADKLNLKLFP
jgi:hypothetical protein